MQSTTAKCEHPLKSNCADGIFFCVYCEDWFKDGGIPLDLRTYNYVNKPQIAKKKKPLVNNTIHPLTASPGAMVIEEQEDIQEDQID